MKKSRFKWLAFRNIDGFLISLTGFFLILIYTSHSGIGISPDSIIYLSVARNIDLHGTLLDYNLRPLVDFPVFYPVFLSVVGFLSRVDLVAVAPYLNGLLFALNIIITGYLIDSFAHSDKIYKRILLVLIALSPSLLDIYSMLWSETLFIFLTLVFITAISKYLSNYHLSFLLMAACIAAVSFITRYAGITVMAAGLMLICFDRKLPLRKKTGHLALFGMMAVSLLILNLWHNTIRSGSLTGPREAGITSLGDNILLYGKVICDWFPLLIQHPQTIIFVVVIIFITVSCVFLYRSISGRGYTTAENCFMAFFIVYTVFIIGVSTLSHFEGINNRLLCPLYIPMLICLSSWIPQSVSLLEGLKSKISLALLSVALIAFMINQLTVMQQMYHEASNYGIAGYTDDSWKTSPLSKFLRQHPGIFDPEYDLYSNAHEAAYFNGGLNAESIPHRKDLSDVHDFFNDTGQYLIWFNNFSDTDLISLATIRKHASVVKQYSFKDGAIYFVLPYPVLPHP